MTGPSLENDAFGSMTLRLRLRAFGLVESVIPKEAELAERFSAAKALERSGLSVRRSMRTHCRPGPHQLLFLGAAQTPVHIMLALRMISLSVETRSQVTMIAVTPAVLAVKPAIVKA